ncbi:MAG: S8/S53 family peptidase [Actinobacteria bacterium]|nr:S8/S53 family peptidase [Actinomycetota bacterium]
MHVKLPIGAASALAALVLLPVAVASGAGSAGWASTATQAEPLGNLSVLGATAPTTAMHVTVALNLRNASALQSLVASGQTITPDQFASTYAPTDAQAAQVASYLTSSGFTNVTVVPGNTLVTADGTAANADAAFDTAISDVSWNGATYYVNTAAAQVPSSLGGIVASVLGLQNVGVMRVGDTGPLPPTGNVGALYTPQDFWKFYDATTAPTGRNTAIAVFAEGNVQPAVTQLGIQETAYGLPKVPVTVVPVGPSSTDTSGEVEWEIDTQNSTGMADGVKRLYVYDATDLTDASTTLEFTDFAHQDVAKAGSASFGECEYQAYLDGSMVATDDAALQAASQGQTMFASSGDQGGFCPYADTNGIGPGGPPFTSYPASSPYFVGVGGTSLFSNADFSRGSEIAWYTSGGGTSLFEIQEPWQHGVVPATGTVCGSQYVISCGRGVPDVAMDADAIISPGAYFDNGTAQPQGGTSLASPLALGSWARFETGHSNTLGWATPLLYKAAGSAGFNDITQGDCEPYPATTGYDFCTGLGSFDVAQMEKVIAPSTAVPTATVPAPFCTLASAPSGDATPNIAGAPLYTGTEAHALDITAFGMTSNGTTLSGAIRVDSLSSGPGGTTEIDGTGDIWYVLFAYKGTTYFLEAQYPGASSTLATFDDGTVAKSATGGEQFSANNSTAATGVLDRADNLVEITVPASEVGSPPAGTSLTATSAQTYAQAGTPAAALLEQADTAPGSSYTMGSTC